MFSSLAQSEPDASGMVQLLRFACVLMLLARLAPFAAMFDDPIGQGLLEPDVPAGFFRFNPFVPKDFLALRLKLAIQRRVLKEIRGVVRCHSQWCVTGL